MSHKDSSREKLEDDSFSCENDSNKLKGNVGLSDLRSFLGFAGSFQDNKEEIRNRKSKDQKIESILEPTIMDTLVDKILNDEDQDFIDEVVSGSVSEKRAPLTSNSPVDIYLQASPVGHKLDEFHNEVLRWVSLGQKDISDISGSLSLVVLSEDQIDPIIFFELGVLFQKGNLLKKEIADFFRGQFSEGREFKLGDGKLTLEFTSSRAFVSRINIAANFCSEIKGYDLIDGVLRWRVVYLDNNGQEKFSHCSTLLADNDMFMELLVGLKKEERAVIFKYEAIRFLLIKYNNMLKNIFQLCLEHVVNVGRMSQFQVGMMSDS